MPDAPNVAAFWDARGFAVEGSGYGDQAYGSTGYGAVLPAAGGGPLPPKGIPQSEIPGNDVTDTVGYAHGIAGVTTHRRNGILIGERTFLTPNLWSIFWGGGTGVGAGDVASFREYFDLRFFRLAHDTNFTTFTPVHWVETEFEARGLRGSDHFELTFTLEAYAGGEIIPP